VAGADMAFMESIISKTSPKCRDKYSEIWAVETVVFMHLKFHR
jgi:hypothetical protein